MIRDLVRRFAKLPHARADLSPGSLPPGAVPLDPVSPWPKFRGNALQTGRTTVAVEVGEGVPWEVATGKGVFSSPVVGADGTVFVGSADQHFYAVSEAGEVLWRHATGGVIDSSALLDDQGRVIFGAGDGRVHCLHRDSGEPAWTFRAHTPEEVGERFGVRTHNVDWFEGNVAMLGDGTVLAPNDNYLVYALDRATGERRTQYVANEMVWSCPAVNPETGRVFFASCFAALVNVFCFDSRTGRKLWTSGGLGTVSASPLLTSADPSGAVLVGGFDGILRALSQRTGKQLWSLGTRDHLYGSPAQLSDGTLVQASTDGSVYGLDPDRGRVR